MKNLLLLTLYILFTFNISAQNFEGKITYKTTYTSKIMFVSDTKLKETMGDIQESFYSENKYLNKMNGKMIEWQLYLPNENKLYSKSGLSESIYWNDAAENKDEIKSININKKATRVLGNMCDEMIIETKSGMQKYYFSTGTLPLNSALYEKHSYGNWNTYLKEANAIPLKYIIDTPQFTMEATASDIKAEKLDDKIFALPANTKFEKAPF